MEVLMYGWEFPPYINGGLGVACEGIVKGLLSKQVDITLVLPIPDEDKAPQFNVLGEKLKIKYIKSILTPYMSPSTYTEIVGKYTNTEKENELGVDLISEVKRYADKAGEMAVEIPHDIIHVHDWLTVLAGVEAKKISKKPLIFHVHALEIDRSYEHPNPTIFEIEKRGFMESDYIIAVSHYTKNLIIDNYKINPEKITVVHNGLSPYLDASFQSNHSKKLNIILFLGRITSQKGPYFFIEAAHKILSTRKNVCFVMAGEGDLLQSMIEHVAKLRIGKYFYFTGFLSRKEVEKIYGMSKVYVMPSLSEPFGISCLEALSKNVPIIISKRSGAAEVLHHVIKVDFWDTNEMASKILAILDYTALGNEMLKNSKADLKKCVWDNSAQKILETYQLFMENLPYPPFSKGGNIKEIHNA